jgi:hypothetical protein
MSEVGDGLVMSSPASSIESGIRPPVADRSDDDIARLSDTRKAIESAQSTVAIEALKFTALLNTGGLIASTYLIKYVHIDNNDSSEVGMFIAANAVCALLYFFGLALGAICWYALMAYTKEVHLANHKLLRFISARSDVFGINKEISNPTAFAHGRRAVKALRAAKRTGKEYLICLAIAFVCFMSGSMIYILTVLRIDKNIALLYHYFCH